jgi:hypothetical protein
LLPIAGNTYVCVRACARLYYKKINDVGSPVPCRTTPQSVLKTRHDLPCYTAATVPHKPESRHTLTTRTPAPHRRRPRESKAHATRELNQRPFNCLPKRQEVRARLMRPVTSGSGCLLMSQYRVWQVPHAQTALCFVCGRLQENRDGLGFRRKHLDVLSLDAC